MPGRTVSLKLDVLADVKKASDSLGRLSQSIGRIGRQLTLKVTLPLAAAGGAMVKFAIDFKHGFAEVRTLVTESEHDIKGLEKGLRAMAQVVPQTLGELTNGLYQVISATADVEGAIERLHIAAMAAVAGVTDTNTAVVGLSKTMNAYGLQAEDTERIADMLFQTVKYGQLKFEDISQAIGSVAGTAALAKVPLEDLFAAIAIGSRIIKNADVTTISLNQAILAFIKPSSMAKAAAEKYGVALDGATLRQVGLIGAMRLLSGLYEKMAESGDEALSAVTELIPNIRALRVVTALAGEQFDEYLRIQQEMISSAGTMREAYAKMADTTKNRLKILGASFQELLVQFGELLLPAMDRVITRLKIMVEKFKELSDTLKLTVISFGTILALLGPLTIALGAFVWSIRWISVAVKWLAPFTLLFIGKLLPGVVSLSGAVARLALMFGVLRLSLIAIAGVSPVGWAIAASVAIWGLIFAVTDLEKEWFKLKKAVTDPEMKKALDDYFHPKVEPVSLFDKDASERFEKIKADYAWMARLRIPMVYKSEEMRLEHLNRLKEEAVKKEAEWQAAIAHTKRMVTDRVYALNTEINALRKEINLLEDSADFEKNKVKILELYTDMFEKIEERRREIESRAETKRRLVREKRAKEELKEREAYNVKIVALEERLVKSLESIDKSAVGRREELEKQAAKNRLALSITLARNIENSTLQTFELIKAATEVYNRTLRDIERKYHGERLANMRRASDMTIALIQETYSSIIQEIFSAFTRQQSYSRQQYELDGIMLNQERARLKDSWREQEISYREYQLRMGVIDKQQRENRQRLEAESVGVMTRIWNRMLSAYSNVLQRILEEYLYTKTVEEAAEEKSIIGKLLKAIANLFEWFTKVFGPFGIPLAVASGVGLLAAFGAFKTKGFAQGGLFKGKGTGISDSNIAAISDGEFIVNAQATKRNLAILSAINAGQNIMNSIMGGVRHFAEGGLVTPMPVSIPYSSNDVIHELRLLRSELMRLKPQVIIDNKIESRIEGRDLLLLVRTEERSENFRRL